jgi:hypothetical protein
MPFTMAGVFASEQTLMSQTTHIPGNILCLILMSMIMKNGGLSQEDWSSGKQIAEIHQRLTSATENTSQNRAGFTSHVVGFPGMLSR